MKATLAIILGLLFITFICSAQDEEVSEPGWYSIGGVIPLDQETNEFQMRPATGAQDYELSWPAANAAIAEVITPDIQALADSLQDDPVRIFNYVHDHIRYVPYFGSKKGAQLALLERSGNDFDQCALLVALLRAAGYSNTGYQFGWMMLPYDNPDGSHRDIHHWFGLSLTNSNWSYTTSYLDMLLTEFRFYRVTRHNWGDNNYSFQRLWVTLSINGTTYYLDPAFKVSEPISGINLTAATGFSSNALMNAAGGTGNGNYVTNPNEAAIQSLLTTYTTNLLAYLQSNSPNASVEEVLGGQYIIPSTNTSLSTSLLFPVTNMDGTMPVINWSNQPTNLMSTLGFTFAGINYKCYIPQLLGQRLSLTVSSGGSAQLWRDDTLLASGSTGGGSGASSSGLSVRHPAWHGGWDITNNVFIPANPADWTAGATPAVYQNANANYAILYSFEPDWNWLQKRQQQLDAYREQGLADTSRQVLTETLNIMGLNWELQQETLGRLLGQQIGVLPQSAHRLGRMGQESGKGYYVDVYKYVFGSCSSGGSAAGPGADPYVQKWVDHLGFFGSAMEHGLIEELQTSGLVGASTVKMLQFANAHQQSVFVASRTNWAAIHRLLKNYNTNDLASDINAGKILFLPENGNNQINGAGSWSGYGLMVRFAGGSQMLIGPGIYGGFVSDLSAVVNPSYINYSSYVQPSYFSYAPTFVPSLTAADPVSMSDGTFEVSSTDLSLGQTEPRGLSLERHYSSGRRNSNLAGISCGWLHNCFLHAASISAPQTGLGGSTPAQCAPMLAATTAAINLFDGDGRNPKNWLVTALIAKWGIDQLTGKAVSVILGKDTMQFIQQPDGSYTPPAHSSMSLLKTNSSYWLQERHGRTFKFNAAGWATNIVDSYNQGLKLTYGTGATSNYVATVTDWKNRTLTFAYSSTTPKRLTSVADNSSPARTVYFGYSTDGDLVYAADPAGKTNRFLYDTNHQITATSNALGQLVVSNLYNAFGRVTTQYTQGDPNKMWRICWSGWQTVEQDPAGSQRTFFFDDKSRQIAIRDALGNLSQTFYDGQDHVVMTVSPLGETNRYLYDGAQNLLASIDPLGFSNQCFYDGEFNLVRSVDARGNPVTFGYNANSSLIGATNAVGDWVTFSYNADGTLASRTDAGGATSYAYDSWGQLASVTHPGSLGVEGFLNSSTGDVLSRTNARGFVTSFQYNNRRELTNTLAPTNLIAKVAYDAVGNIASVTDARGFTTSNTWSATQKLLKTTLPATPQGTPTITNIYDNRDWLVRSLDPLQRPTLYTNDVAGRLIAASDPLARTTRYGFDADGQILAVTNAALEVARQFWNARGETTRSVDNASRAVTSQYDEAGNQVSLTNRNGKVWQFQFDAANRLTNTITPLNRQTKLAFDDRGLLKNVREPSGQITSNFYDAKGRLTNSLDGVASTVVLYDANDNVTNLVENGLTNTWTFDAYDRVASYTDAEGNLIQYRYDANGNLTNLIYPGNRTVTYFYDSLNRLTNVTDWASRITSLEYDLASRVRKITRPNGTVRLMDYDAAGELTNIIEQAASKYPIAFFKLNYNAAARVAWEFAAPLPHAYTPPSRTITVDDDNRIATFNSLTVVHDADGNMTSGPLTNNTLSAYTYDARNRLLSAGGLSYAYDPTGNRVGITNGANVTRFVVNPNASQVLMRVRPGVTNYYVYGLGLLYEVTETATATTTLTYHYDSRGSTIALTEDYGNITDRIEYSAYGSQTYRAGTSDTPFLFNGRYGVQTDANGLLHMRARYYNPYLCRFINADPSGFSGGLNHYAYVDGNPVSNLDPFGLGAMGESALSRSWIDNLWSDLGVDNSIGAQMQRAQAVTSFADFASLGLANDISSAVTGRDLNGNRQTTTERAVAGAMAAMRFHPD